ncbi:MAG: beta family protein [Thermodesulfobacteriota bacterium]
MFTHKHYVPVLKWKQGEYQALNRLDNAVKDNLTPLLEIPPVGYDFETGIERESIDDHLDDFGRRLKAKWHNRPCFVDAKYVDSAVRMSDGRHFIETIFEHARSERCRAIPVVGLSNDLPWLAATAAAIRADARGVALRLTPLDFDRADLPREIRRVLTALDIDYGDSDLIVDVEAPNFQPLTMFVQMIVTCVRTIPRLTRWRSFTITGTSYPATIAGLRSPFQEIPRLEWRMYQRLVNRLGTATRLPTFGDYAVAHPEPIALNMRLVKPFAKLRYTSNDFWYIGKGTNVRDHGYSQYRQLCQTLMAHPCFDGRGSSAGDDYIADCAQGTARTGNLTTWVWVSTNRHLTKVVNDLATFHVP